MRTLAYLLVLIALAVSNPFTLLASQLSLLHIEFDLLSQAVALFEAACRLLGIDLVHFGVVVVVNTMIGLITPPYGILLFVINGTTGIPLRSIIREILPFLAVLLIALAAMVLIPDIALWLPRQFGYHG